MADKQVDSLDLNLLRQTLIDLFTLSEIKDLCATLKVDYDLLPGGEKSSKARELVDFMRRNGRIQDLIRAIQTARPQANLRLRPAIDQASPYRGLFAFGEEHAENFFGRETYTEKLLTAVETQSFIAFVGPSGSGKSSVLFAGLVPRLRKKKGYQIISFRPGNRPFYHLATALISLDTTLVSRTTRLDETQRLTTALLREDNPLSLNDFINDLLQGKSNLDHLLLIVDQFEEIYTLVSNDADRERFLDVVVSLSNASNIKTLVSLRADFLGQVLDYRPLADIFQKQDIKLGAMTIEELQQAIRFPVHNSGVKFAPGLEDRIVRDIVNSPGNLPLLQFALTQMWEQQFRNEITHETYEEIGRVDGALAIYANQVYDNLQENLKARAKRVLTRLVNLSQGKSTTRKLIYRDDLSKSDWQVVQQLTNNRLLVTGQDEDEVEIVELVHEALIQGWDKLRQWLEDDRSFLLWLNWFRISLQQWHNSNKNKEALLQGLALNEANIWLTERKIDLTLAEQNFIEVSTESFIAKKDYEAYLEDILWAHEDLQSKYQKLTLEYENLKIQVGFFEKKAEICQKQLEKMIQQLDKSIMVQDALIFATNHLRELRVANLEMEKRLAYKEETAKDTGMGFKKVEGLEPIHAIRLFEAGIHSTDAMRERSEEEIANIVGASKETVAIWFNNVEAYEEE